MQVVAEHFLAVLGVLDGLQDVRMPELVHVLAQEDVFGVVGVFRQHGQIGLVRNFDAVGVFARPAFSPHGVHHSDFDGFKIKRLYCGSDLPYWSCGQLCLHFVASCNTE